MTRTTLAVLALALAACSDADPINPDPPTVIGAYTLDAIDNEPMPFVLEPGVPGHVLGRMVLSGRLVITGTTWQMSRTDSIITVGQRGRISRFRTGVYTREDTPDGVRLLLVDPMFGDTIRATWADRSVGYVDGIRDFRWAWDSSL